tara:strand:+ start:6274 stop:6870 length:597 start_codon:yes stop_codon:yes gene_type:complete
MESKKIVIIGKQACQGLTVDKKDRIRSGLEEQQELTIEQSLSSLLSLNTVKEAEYSRTFRRELEKKINGYKQQDIKRKLHDESTLINLKETVNKLLTCGMRCCYCDKRVKVIYRRVRDKYQWTLDRIDNDKNHSNHNTVIACLSCNLSRRRRTKEAFEFHWKTKIVKVNKVVEVDDSQSTSSEASENELSANDEEDSE